MDSQTVFNILVLIFGGGGVAALGAFFLNFRKQGTEEVMTSRTVLLEDNERYKRERDEANKRADLAEITLRAIRDILTPEAIMAILEAYERKHGKVKE